MAKRCASVKVLRTAGAIEDKGADLSRGTTQLAVELIAFDVATQR